MSIIRLKVKASLLSKIDQVGCEPFIPGLAMVGARGYTQSSRKSWNDFIYDYDLLWPQTNYPVFGIAPQCTTHPGPEWGSLCSSLGS